MLLPPLCNFTDLGCRLRLLLCESETMSKSDDKIALPKRISEPGTNGGVLDRINKRSNLKLVEVNRFDKMEKVDVKCILGDPELHSDLVEDVDTEFGRVVDLVKRGYRLKRQDWLNGSVDIVIAEAEMDENNSAPGIDATDQKKIEFFTKKVVSLEEKVKYLEGLLNIRGETVKLWALSSVNQLGTFFGIRNDEIQFPLCLHWIETKSLTIEEVNRFDKMEKVDVKCIFGDPELHSDLVEDVDSEFGRVVDLVKRGYRLKRQDWLNGSVDIAVAEAEVDENNYAPGIDATDQEKIEFLTKNVVSLEKKMKNLEGFLNIRGETLNGKKKGIRPPGEVDHQVEDDTEVEHGAKESGTTKVNEGQTQEEEEHQVEDDADVYVGAKGNENPETNEGKKKSVKPSREVQQQVEDDAQIGAKESENPETNKDGEVNEDASKKPVKFTKKRERGNKEPNVDTSKSQRQKNKKIQLGTKKRGRATTGKKKCVTSPREVQQQVEDHAETNEDGERNEDASKKHVKLQRNMEEEIRNTMLAPPNRKNKRNNLRKIQLMT
ncbi:hypothetical protein F2Q69_00034642 [Brassica cretica]|uniref:DUF287 domain-containing protein n=1 Tax=Brassica cretica TaxID=69181 RepID=A0A8S9SSH2_BRACR|nr:hypothetical protein F2Q69_00034642 [Brassica cretica]